MDMKVASLHYEPLRQVSSDVGRRIGSVAGR